MNGVTGGVVRVVPWSTTTFSHTSTTVRRRSAGRITSSWYRALAVGSLDERHGGMTWSTKLICEDTGVDSTIAQAENGTSDDVFGIEHIWFVEDLLLAVCFEGEAFGVPAITEDEVGTESEVVGEDLVAFRGSGVGILDAAREDKALETGLDSRGRLVGTVVALREGNDNWQVSVTGSSENGRDGRLDERSFDRFCRFVCPTNLGLACSIESFKLADTIDSFRLDSVSALSSATSLPNVRAFERLSAAVSRGSTLGLE